jgi:Pyridine nucleotide-disulphide oxidoreductase, dimerisation domain
MPLCCSPLISDLLIACVCMLALSAQVVGMHMVGDEAPEILQGFAAAMQVGITKSQLDRTVGIHPTGAEEFVATREVVRRLDGKGGGACE